MAINATEIGKDFYYATSFDMSSNTALEIHLESPEGEMTVITNPRVTAPAVDAITTEGTLPANTYMVFTTIETDFPVAGDWEVCGIYINGTLQRFYGNKATATIGAEC